MFPKSTAETVLLGLWLTACDGKPLPTDLVDYTDRMLAAMRNPARWLFRNRAIRWMVHRGENRGIPGVCAHYGARKVRIQQLVDEINPAVLVVLGAGLDGLAYMQASRRTVAELDRGELQSRKRSLLAQLPAKPITFVAADLPAGDNLPRFDKPTTYVAEGVFMYLTESEVEQVLAELPSGSTLIFTFVGLDDQGHPSMSANQAKIDRMLEAMNEPFRWGIRPEQVEAFLNKNGFALASVSGVGCAEVDGMIHGEWIAHSTKR
ncbi:MAG: class I SAM-dependent methyltransferase [Fimbriimonadaceae bacterium]|nr:class I SAM-dependent methyltransferase [Fimbriimonadaceae bacterium]